MPTIGPHNLGSPMSTFKCSGSKASAHPRKFTLNLLRLQVSNKGLPGSTESTEKAPMTYLDQLEIGTFVDSYELCKPCAVSDSCKCSSQFCSSCTCLHCGFPLGEQCSARFWGIMGRDHDPRVSKSNRLHVTHCSVIHHQFEVYSLNSSKTIRNFS
jgi:hypothetical protein